MELRDESNEAATDARSAVVFFFLTMGNAHDKRALNE